VKKLRSFLVALLLVPALALNANAFTTDVNASVYTAPQAPQQSSNMCWVYYLGRWILVPC
jgi:hypothetical protein